MKLRLWLSTILLAPTVLCGTDLTPWLTTDFEIQSRATVLYQTYPYVNATRRKIGNGADDFFSTLSIGGAAFGYSAEVEATLANTRKQHSDCDNVRLTGRYRVFDDIEGEDPVTLTAGLTVTQAFRHSLFDVSSFHHGQIEGEAHVAIGKETPFQSLWLSRWWSVLGIGMGDKGCAWLRGDVSWERNWCNQHMARVFMHSLWGFGHYNLSNHKKFKGYGPINHQSIDLGGRYTYIFDIGATLSIEYAYRVYALNFPARANLVRLSFLYPFWF